MGEFLGRGLVEGEEVVEGQEGWEQAPRWSKSLVTGAAMVTVVVVSPPLPSPPLPSPQFPLPRVSPQALALEWGRLWVEGLVEESGWQSFCDGGASFLALGAAVIFLVYLRHRSLEL